MLYLKLFADFFKVSCFTFGGAYGAIPLIRDMVMANGWCTEEQLAYMIAVSESTPGPIMVNMATYVGSTQAGFWGSVLATFGVVLPAYLVIMLVIGVLKNAIRHPGVQAVLQGLKPCVTGIVLATGSYMVLHNAFPLSADAPFSWQALVITAVLAAVMVAYPRIFRKKLPPTVLILCSAVLGMVVFSL